MSQRLRRLAGGEPVPEKGKEGGESTEAPEPDTPAEKGKEGGTPAGAPELPDGKPAKHADGGKK